MCGKYCAVGKNCFNLAFREWVRGSQIGGHGKMRKNLPLTESVMYVISYLRDGRNEVIRM